MAQAQKRALAGSMVAKDVIDELRKVTWPTREETIKLTLIVIVISLLIGAYIGIIDVLLTKLLEMFTKVR
jgi:preprotein translocase subunit SecE